MKYYYMIKHSSQDYSLEELDEMFNAEFYAQVRFVAANAAKIRLFRLVFPAESSKK